MDNRGRFLIVLCAFAGTGAPWMKLGFESAGVFPLMFGRFAIASLILLALIDFSLAIWRRLIPVCVIGAVSILVGAMALDGMPASVFPVIFALAPAFTIVQQAAVGKAVLTPRNISSIFLGIIGVLVLTSFTPSDFTTAGSGLAVAFTSVGLWAAYGIASTETQSTKRPIKPIEVAFYLCATATTFAVPLSVTELSQPQTAISFDWSLGIAIGYLALSSVTLTILYQKLVNEYSATAASYSLFIGIPINASLAMVLLGEQITTNIVTGTALVLVAAALLQESTTKQRVRMPIPAYIRRR